MHLFRFLDLMMNTLLHFHRIVFVHISSNNVTVIILIIAVVYLLIPRTWEIKTKNFSQKIKL